MSTTSPLPGGPPPENISTMLYRLNALEQQLKQLQEQQLKQLQEQFKMYVPVRENDLQLQTIQVTVSRIERDVVDMKARQEAMEKEARERIEQQQKEQAALQIRVLVSVVSFVVVIIGGVITAYLTHTLH